MKLFDGLKSDLTGTGWFERINAIGAKYGLEIEHYIISAGLEEMIDGCPIRDAFHHVFASKFVYDEHGVAIWPAVGVNYTTKTQYLFRINKGVLNHWDARADQPLHGRRRSAGAVRADDLPRRRRHRRADHEDDAHQGRLLDRRL